MTWYLHHFDVVFTSLWRGIYVNSVTIFVQFYLMICYIPTIYIICTENCDQSYFFNALETTCLQTLCLHATIGRGKVLFTDHGSGIWRCFDLWRICGSVLELASILIDIKRHDIYLHVAILLTPLQQLRLAIEKSFEISQFCILESFQCVNCALDKRKI